MGVAQVLSVAGFFAMWYVAVEPLVRRAWPECLVTRVRFANRTPFGPARRPRYSDRRGNGVWLYDSVARPLCRHPGDRANSACMLVLVSSFGCWGNRHWHPGNLGRLHRLHICMKSLFLCLADDATFVSVPDSDGCHISIFINLVLFRREDLFINVLQQTLCWIVLTFVVFRYGLLAFVICFFSRMLLEHFPLTTSPSKTAMVGLAVWRGRRGHDVALRLLRNDPRSERSKATWSAPIAMSDASLNAIEQGDPQGFSKSVRARGDLVAVGTSLSAAWWSDPCVPRNRSSLTPPESLGQL